MYKWKIDIILKMSGKQLVIYYSGNEDNSNAVANLLLDHSYNTYFKGFANEDGTKNVFVDVTEIASFTISVNN